MAPKLVTLTRVEKHFRNGTQALAGVDLTIAPGEFLSILGPSGCGKSTVLRIIAGLTPPSSGSVTWSDGESRQPGPRDIGFVFQEPTLMPWARVADNVALPLRLAGMKRHDAMARAEAGLSHVGLSDFAKAFPRELSGGMRMRVSLARALVTEPRILLLDEPFAALDEITRQQLNDDLLTLWGAHRFTVVFVTHSVFESVYMAERIVIMRPRPGRIVQELQLTHPPVRTAEYRLTPAYAASCADASAALADAMAA